MSKHLNGTYKFQNTDEVPEIPTVPVRNHIKVPADQKKPRTPAQIEASRKLGEANKAKALARRGLMTEMPKPEDIPAGMRVVQVVKRAYNKTKPRYNEPIPEEKEIEMPIYSNHPLFPHPYYNQYPSYAQHPPPSHNVNGAFTPQYPPYYALPPQHPQYGFQSAIPAIQEKKVEKEKKRRGRKPSEKKKPMKSRPYESTEDDTESGYDNEDTETETEPETDTEAILKKTTTRMKAIEAINARLAETKAPPKNRLSVFS